MSYAILLAASALILSAAGLLLAYRLYCTGELRRRCLLASALGFVSLTLFLLFVGLSPKGSDGRAALAFLVPAFVALPIILRNRKD